MNENHLKKNLNLFSLCIFGIGVIVGAGIYSVIGVAYGYAGTSLWISFILAALAAILTAFSYCELSSMFPSAGAEYVYLRKAFPNLLSSSFIIAAILLVAETATAATVARAFGNYLQYFTSLPSDVSAIVLITVASLINFYGIQSSNYFNIILTLIELFGIVLVIWFGFTIKTPVQGATFSLGQGTFTATSLIFFVYLGFEEIANLAEETKNPSKDVPRAIFLSLLITTVLYLAVSFSLIALADVKSIATSHFPLAQALAKVSPKMETVLSVIALFSTANTVLITLLVGARMLFSVAREGDLPACLSKTHQRFYTPHIASSVMLILSCLFLFAGDFEVLVSLSSFATLLAFGSVNLAVIWLRYKMENATRPFTIPFSVKRFPLIPGLGLLVITVLCLQFSKRIYFYSFVFSTCFFIYYMIWNNYRTRPFSSDQN